MAVEKVTVSSYVIYIVQEQVLGTDLSLDENNRIRNS